MVFKQLVPQKTLNVLVCAPSMPGFTFLPYIYNILREACDEDAELAQSISWLPPTFLFEPPRVSPEQVDVLALSCYTWNWRLNMKIAKKFKEINPEILVVLGGPEPNWQDKDFFIKYPFVDLVVKYEGEETFREVLKAHLHQVSFQNISGLIINHRGQRQETENRIRLKHFPSRGSYQKYRNVMTQIVRDRPKGKPLYATLETNRGCPYFCSFCDWGSATYSKIRNIPIERVKDDIKTLAELGVQQYFIADANFGIQKRDLELAKYIGETKQHFDFPKGVTWSSAKNNSRRVISIAEELVKTGLNRSILINYQTTNRVALQNMNRQNMNPREIYEMVTSSESQAMPTTAVIIIGAPGETMNSHKQTLAELLNAGHSALRWNPYFLLPNAPAMTEAYRKKFDLVSIERDLPMMLVKRDEIPSPYRPKVKYLIGHKTLTPADWVELMVLTAICNSTYFMGLYRDCIDFLKQAIPCEQIVEDLYISMRDHPIVEKVRQSLLNFIDGQDTYFLSHPELNYELDIDKYLYLHLSISHTDFKDCLKKFLLRLSNDSPLSAEWIDLMQYTTARQVFYEDKNPAQIKLQYQWPNYFEEDQSLSKVEGVYQKEFQYEFENLDDFFRKIVDPIVHRHNVGFHQIRPSR